MTNGENNGIRGGKIMREGEMMTVEEMLANRGENIFKKTQCKCMLESPPILLV